MAGAVGPEGSNHLAWRRPCMFYKLIVASILQDKKLKIPGKFAKKYGHDILSIVTLSVANGCSWLVETENVNGKLQFCNGWQEFLENHSIGDGYLLIFIYEGKSKFTVNIFDLAVSQIRHPCKALGSLQQSHDKQCLIPPEKDGLDIGYTRILGSDSLGLSPVSFRSSISDQYFSYSGPQSGDCGSNMEQLHQRQAAYKLGATFQSSRDVGTQVSDFELKGSMLVPGGAKERTKRQKQRGEPAVSEPEPPDIQKAEIKSLRSKIAPKASASRLRAVTAEGRTRVIHAAEEFKPSNPFFRIILRETHVYRRFSLRIPSDFARAYLSKVTGFIKLQASDGKQWLARCIHYNDVTILSKGWLTFARDNKLEEGDACIFELISSSSDVLLKVSIFRVQEEATPVVQPSKVNCFEFASKTGEGSSLTSDRVEGRSRSRKRRTEPEPPVIQEVEIESPCLNTASKAIDGLETVTAEERKRAVHAAYAFKPDNPFFRVILRPTYVYRGFKLNVPVSFGLKYLSTATGFIKLQNSDGKQWSARFIRRDGQAVLSAGWRAFARDNKLEDGDVCVFVLMNTSDIVLEVKIFRVHEFVIPLDQSPEVDCVQLASTTTEGSSLISDGAKGGTRSKKQRTEPDKPQATQKAEMKLPCLEISSGMSLRRLRAVTTEGKIKAIHTAYAFKPDNPFFRVILRPTHVYRGFLLRIPASFSQRYLSSVGEFIKLQVSNGKQWPARCIKRNGIVALSKGWVAFARDNKLEEGDVCVFELISISDCVLNVAIFRVPEDAEPVAQPSKLDGFDVECTASEGREPVDEQQPSGQHEDETEACFRFRQNAAARKITVAAEQRDRAVERAKAFQSINPFCQVVMRPSYLYDGCSLHLPSGFAKTHLSGVSGFIKLQSPEGKQWSVQSNCRRHVRARLSRGWYEFSLENNLREGDVCVFELMESRDIVLMVTVFRVSESAGRLTDHLGQVKCELN